MWYSCILCVALNEIFFKYNKYKLRRTLSLVRDRKGTYKNTNMKERGMTPNKLRSLMNHVIRVPASHHLLKPPVSRVVVNNQNQQRYSLILRDTFKTNATNYLSDINFITRIAPDIQSVNHFINWWDDTWLCDVRPPYKDRINEPRTSYAGWWDR